MNRVTVLLLCVLAACAPSPSSFVRLKGPALQFNIPMYQGEPNTIYTRVDRGRVEGKAGAASSQSEQKYRAIYNLVEAARAAGANAIIEVEGKSTNEGFLYSGRAVSFDVYPPDSATTESTPAAH